MESVNMSATPETTLEPAATPTATTSVEMPVLKLNNSGEAVRFLQQMLICYGYLSVNDFDAVFRRSTENAVKNYQLDSGLKVDGIVGRNTWRALSARCSIR